MATMLRLIFILTLGIAGLQQDNYAYDGHFTQAAERGGATFANDAKLLDHFARHGADFGASTPAEYEAMADRFLTGDLTEGGLEATRPNSGDLGRFNPATDEFGVLKSDGLTIKTYYKPDPAVHGFPTNLDYFNSQFP
jgi:pyocin large subunit-like protein